MMVSSSSRVLGSAMYLLYSGDMRRTMGAGSFTRTNCTPCLEAVSTAGADAGALGGLVELHQREQVVAVGDRQRGHAQFHRPAQQVGLFGLLRVGMIRFLGHADDRIRERKLGVQVEVDETGRHAGSECGQGSVPAGVGWGKA